MTRSRGFVIRARKVYLNKFKKEIQFLTIDLTLVFINIETGRERISVLSLRIGIIGSIKLPN
jgi:hypothetical protein